MKVCFLCFLIFPHSSLCESTGYRHLAHTFFGFLVFCSDTRTRRGRDVAVAMAVVRFPLTNPGFLGVERDTLGFDTALWAWFFDRKTRI